MSADVAACATHPADAEVNGGNDDIDPEIRDTIYGTPLHQPTGYEVSVLCGMQRRPHVYQGTVDPVVVAHRRRRNKAARQSRRQNRVAS